MTTREKFADLSIKRSHVGKGYAHDSAKKHVEGTAIYVDDMAELPRTLHAALVLSPVAHGHLSSIDITKALALDGVVRVLSAKDVPGHNEVAPILAGEPLFATNHVEHVGQIVAAVAAEDFETAVQAARLVELDITPLDPVLDVKTAHINKSYALKSQHLVDGDAKSAIADAENTFEGTFNIGGQDHFYLEGQIAYALPGEDRDVTIHSSTQHPTEVQHHVAHVLGIPAHSVDVRIRRMGGGFGGKESHPTIIAAIAALFADAENRPCKLRLRRHDDMQATGKRHDYVINWTAGVDANGRFAGLDVECLANAGNVADLTGPVITRTLTHLDNCYHIPNADFIGHGCKTNTVSNTAFRGFGGPQGIVAIEGIIDVISRKMGLDPNHMRTINYYGETTGEVTPYGQDVPENRITDVVDRLMASAEWEKRRKEIDAQNATNPLLRRGLAMMPVKFGISFNLTALNQAGALVHVYQDGSVHLNHGGTEMGQGIFTKVAQVVAEVFQIGVDQIKITSTNTGKVPNTSATAASTGSDINGAAAFRAADAIKQRMTKVAAKHLQVSEDKISFVDGRISGNGQSMTFAELAHKCWFSRISLSATGFYATPEIHWDSATLKGRPFFYFTYGAAIAEVAIDTLTGETRCLRADILQDCGKPLNPTIDLGQVEGAFVQGMGWLTCEELWWDDEGRLATIGPSTYKIPGSRDVPPVFNVAVLDDKPNHEETIFRSKAVGEPPLMLGISVWLAIRDAISSISGGKFAANLDTPATPERVLFSVENMKQMCKEAQ